MKKINGLIFAVFIVISINSAVYGQEISIKDDLAINAVNPEYRPSKSTLLQLTQEERNITPMVSPMKHLVENMVDPESVDFLNINTGKVNRISSNDSKPQGDGSNLNITDPYQGILPSAMGYSPQTIFSPDDRTRVYGTTGYPYRTVVEILMGFPSGAWYTCSGAIIDNFHVLTAAHCIYSSGDGGWANYVRVIPGLDDTDMPYNVAYGTYLRTYAGWTDYGDYRYDQAIVNLDRNVGYHTGWMGRQWATAEWWYVDPIYTGVLNTAGYPGDMGGSTMWFDSDYGDTADSNNHWFWMDINNGQSGSPVWRFDGTNRYILSVVTNHAGSSGGNMGNRLNENKYNNINTWLAEDAPYPPTDKADLLDDGEYWSGFSPATVQPGNSFQAWNDVRNVGTASSGGFYVAYYASTNNIISTGDYYIGSAYVSSISSFNWADSSFSGTFPSTIPPGTYYVGYIIDSGGNVAEFDEGNNIDYVSSTLLTVTWPLYVSVSESPDPVTSGGTSLVTVHVTTTGGVSVNGASVTVSTTGGSLSPTSGTTDSSGNFVATYTPPSVSSNTVYTISSSASKTGHSSGSGSDTITVKPAISLGEAVDNTGLVWTTGGNRNWFGQDVIYYYGTDAAQSGDILDYQNSTIQTTVTGPGTLNFTWKVSSEVGWDYLKFYIDGVLQTGMISGEVGWEQKSYGIASGTHTLKWEYIKDSIFSSGSDAGWLDKVEFSPQLIVTVSESPDPVNSGSTALVTVHVTTTGGAVVSGASVGVSATGGSLSPVSGTTDVNGDFKPTYTAPSVGTTTTYTISGTASKTGYTSGSGSDTITVNPPSSSPLYVSITESPDPVNSGSTALVTVHVTTTGGALVSGASVSVSATGGSLSPASGTTDANGDFKPTYTAPSVGTTTTYTISGTASKTGYTSGSGSDAITVNPTGSVDNTVSIEDVNAGPASETRVPIRIISSTGVAGVSVKLNYNPAVVVAYSDPILDKGDFMDFYAADNSQNTSGSILITAMKFAPGSTEQDPVPLALTGNPVVGYVRLRAVGNAGDTSGLSFSDVVLTDDNGNDVAYALRNGIFTISVDGIKPTVTNPAVNQSDIPDDTDNIPLWGETARLDITVTDASGIASVTVNLAQIGGPVAKPMINIGGNVYSTTTSASAGTVPNLYNLMVNATDTFGNSNTSVNIELRVRKNGDTNGNNAVNIGDALRLANNVSYPGNPAYVLSSIYVADVSGNGALNIGDALRLANNVSYPGNPAYVLK